jgi:trehalose 6-phosphate synthase
MIIVSNRLPITIAADPSGFTMKSSNGGLVSALTPILNESGGHWVGWTGTDYDKQLVDLIRTQWSPENYTFVPLFLSAFDRTCFYQGCSNEIFWPLFHGLSSRCRFDPEYWKSYRRVNAQFASVVGTIENETDVIWVHDYHLMLLADALRRRGTQQRIAYFHHIPFPPPDIFEALPWRAEVLRALMRFNVIGFQTPRDTQNFIACVRHWLPDMWVSPLGERMLVQTDDGDTTVGTYPISIDYDSVSAESTGSEVSRNFRAIKEGFANTRIVLGVDRLDYTKGIPERLNAFQRMLEQYPELRGRVTLVQIVVPSREEIPEYADLRLRVETMISQINGKYADLGWVPIHFFYRSIPRSELIAFYRAAHVALVTPLKDGMNLIAKEFCAARVDKRGVLVLSEFAGAACELKHSALVVNPHDTERMASVIHAALRMDESEQKTRMEAMRSHICRHDVFRWSRTFTEDAIPALWNNRIVGNLA